jgi:hypothetical protein
MGILTKLLTLLIWTGIAGLLLLLYRIAHFFQLTTGVRSYYRLFLVPTGLFLIGMARYLVLAPTFTGDVLGDVLFFLGGVSLALLGHYLLELMTGGRW